MANVRGSGDSAASRGFFDAPAEPLEERAATRLARAFGTADERPASLISAIFDSIPSADGRPPTLDVATSPVSGPVAPPAAPAVDEAPYGLGDYSFERFFAGLEEDAPSAPDATSPDGSAPRSAASPADAALPVHDAWPAFAAPASHATDARTSDARTPDGRASDERTAAIDGAPPAQPVSDDEDLAQFNAWLKGLLEP
jgi:hypothetical protein